MKTVAIDELTGTVMHHAVNAYLREVSWSLAVDDAVDDITGQFAQAANGDVRVFSCSPDEEQTLLSVMRHVYKGLPADTYDGDDPLRDLATNMGARLVRTILSELERSLEKA